MSRLLAIALLAGACAPYMVVPTAVHPTATAGSSVGVAVGGVYVNPEGTDTDEIAAIPHAEGWIRSAVGTNAQVGLHVGPNVAHVGLRYDVIPPSEGGITLGIEPLVGGGYGKMTAQDDTDEQNVIAIGGGVNVNILMPTGSGLAYVVPKLGFGWFKNYDGSSMTDEEGQKLYTLGLSAGIELAGGLSIELAVHRIDDAESEEEIAPGITAPDPDPIWLVVPTIGLKR